MGTNYITPRPAWERVLRRSVVTDACWLWQGYRQPSGHGQIQTLRGGRRRVSSCHRVSWEHHFGAVPKDLCVLHKCDVANCVNPAHLFLGTRTDNANDRLHKGRAPKGPDLPQSKLTPEKVRWIRSCGLTQKQMATTLGVAQATISHAKTGKKWGWVK